MRRDLFVWAPVDPAARGRDAFLFLYGLAWLLYTRLYFVLHPLGLTLAPSLFMHLTGRPDPLCGLTRTFAWMWRGDPLRAIAVYPLGPVVFVASLAGMAVLAIRLLAGRSPALRLSRRAKRALLLAALAALLANWAAKLLWLGI